MGCFVYGYNLTTTKFTIMDDQQKEMMLTAIDSHIGMLYRCEQDYHRNGDTEMVKEMLDEIRKYENLKQDINSL